MKLRNILLTTVATAVMSATAYAGDIDLTVKKVKNSTGQVTVIAFHESQAGEFPTGQAFRTETKPAQEGEMKFYLDNVPNGKWAIGVYHDLDSNNKLNLNFIGAPEEPTANTGKKVFLKPKFDDSSFDVSDEKVAVVDASF